MTNVQVKCNCGKMANEADWNNDSQIAMLHKKFGSLDDHYFFICECGEITNMHYTGYDSLMEQYEYAQQMNDDVKCLMQNGHFTYETRFKEQSLAMEMINGFSKIHFINDGYEQFTFYRKGADFKQVVFNPIHNTYEVFKYEAEPEGMQNLINHFFK